MNYFFIYKNMYNYVYISCILSLMSRWLTPEMIRWVAGTGRFVFHKDTSLQLDTMISKIRAVQSVPNTPLK